MWLDLWDLWVKSVSTYTPGSGVFSGRKHDPRGTGLVPSVPHSRKGRGWRPSSTRKLLGKSYHIAQLGPCGPALMVLPSKQDPLIGLARVTWPLRSWVGPANEEVRQRIVLGPGNKSPQRYLGCWME